MTAQRRVRAVLVAFVAATVFLPSVQGREVQPVERVAALTRPAVVYLEVGWAGWLRDQRDGKLWLEDAIETGATCSGSLISPNGYVLTAGHCVEAELVVPDLIQGTVDAYVANGEVAEEDAQTFYDEVAENSTYEGAGEADAELVPTITVYRGIIEKGERTGDAFEAEVVEMLSFAHNEGDTAILKLKSAKDLPTIEISDELDIGVGTPIVAIGYPGSVSRIIDPTLEPTFKDGTVSAQRTQSGIPFYEVSAASTPGMSGGPVVDLEGKIVAIVSQAPADEPQSFNLVASASIARDLMQKNDVTNEPGPNDATYREGLERLFDGKYSDAVESFDAVLRADPKHQQAFEIKQQAARRAAEGGDEGGGLPPVAAVPLLLGAGGFVYSWRQRRKKLPVVASVPDATPALVAATPAPTNPLECPSCGHVQARAVAFCTKCGKPMSGAAAPAELERKPGGRDRLIAIGSIAAVAVAVVLVVMSLGGDDGGSVLPTPTPKASQAPRVEGVAGVWGSTFGDVTLEHDELDGDDPVDVTGSWIQGPDKVGEITSGTFDPSEGTLEIGYTENWEGGVEGTAFFELSEDGDTLSGTYEQPNSRGEWVLSR